MVNESGANPTDVLQRPYVGLRPYEASERNLFFGRPRDGQLLLNKIFSAPLTILYAPSGVGKTSLLKVLVIPDIEEHGDYVVYVDQWPKGDPYPALKSAIIKTSESQTNQPLTELAELSLSKLMREVSKTPDQAWVIILDQFEQVLLQSNSFDVLGRELGSLVRSNLDVYVVLSLREEFLARLQVFREHIPALFSSTYRLEHLSGHNARRAIEGPGKEFHALFEFENELVDVLLKDLKIGAGSAGASTEAAEGEGIDLPIMQIVCDRLWREK